MKYGGIWTRVALSTPPGSTTELWPPLGLLYIASSVRTMRGDDVKIIDAFCENLTVDGLARRVVDLKPDVFGINCSTHTCHATMATLEALRDKLPDTKLVMGGFHATFAAEQILRKYPLVDYIIKGEAERAFPQLLDSIDGHTPLSNVQGISYVDAGGYHSNPPARIDDLDELPFPDRSLLSRIEYGYYHQSIRLTFGKFTTVCTSRGCPYSCTYCSCAAFSQRRWRPRSAENVAAELEALYGDGYESCVFVDDNFSLDPKRVLKICDKIKEKRIKMDFCCEARVDGVSSELLRAMKSAGFNVIYFGAESACQHVLDYYNKTITPEKTRKAMEDAKNAGMIVVSSFIFGAPVESSEDMRRTIQFIRDTRPHAIQINILDCLIGTPIWNDLVERGIPGPDDWSRNHRIYEYNKQGPSKSELEQLVNEGYEAYVGAWKTWQLLPELANLLIRNRSSRKIIFGNVFNPDVRRRLSEGMSKPAPPDVDSPSASSLVDEHGETPSVSPKD